MYCVYTFMCIYVYVFMCMHIYTHIREYICVYKRVHKRINICIMRSLYCTPKTNTACKSTMCCAVCSCSVVYDSL